MNTALTTAGAVRVPPRSHESIIERMSRRGRHALGAWARRAPQRLDREQLAELHERHVEAERLRNERFSSVAVGRFM